MYSFAAVAQLDRVLGYEPRGRGFDSCQPRHIPNGSVNFTDPFFIVPSIKFFPLRFCLYKQAYRKRVNESHSFFTLNSKESIDAFVQKKLIHSLVFFISKYMLAKNLAKETIRLNCSFALSIFTNIAVTEAYEIF